MKAKKGFIILEGVNGSLRIDLVPGQNGSWKNAYLRFEGSEGYYGSIDNGNIRRLKKLKKWVSKIR